jgi:hypothetical protein
MVGRDRMRDVLQQHRLTGARRRHDQRALALAERRNQVDDARRPILDRRIVDFHLEPLIGIERRQVVEIDLVAAFSGSSKLMC